MTKEKLTIVKAGGKVLDGPVELNKLLDGFAAIEGKKLLVHGGGIFIDQLCEKLNIPTQMVEGRRITSPENMDVVLMACGGKLNKELVTGLNSRQMSAVGLCGGDFNIIQSVKRSPVPVDFGQVGDVVKVETQWLQMLINNGAVPVISSISQSNNFELLNTNADTIAAHVASALSAHYHVELYFYFDRPGVLLNANDNNSALETLSFEYFEKLKADKVINKGMLPKLTNGFMALQKGVSSVVTGNNLIEKTGFAGTKLIL
jgi:acetylglutamate kinase